MDLADVTERLMAEFEHQIELSVITRVVLQCRRDLDTPAIHALPELLERLARQRLLDQLPTGTRARVPAARSSAGPGVFEGAL